MTIKGFPIFVLLFGAFSVFGLDTKVPVKDCGSPLAYLTRLEVIPCEKDVCVLTRGENATLIVDFVTKVRSEALAINVYQQDNLFNLDSVIWHKHSVCDKYNITCPSEAYQTHYAYFRITLPKHLPSIKLRLKVVLLGDGDTQFLCKTVPLDIR